MSEIDELKQDVERLLRQAITQSKNFAVLNDEFALLEGRFVARKEECARLRKELDKVPKHGDCGFDTMCYECMEALLKNTESELAAEKEKKAHNVIECPDCGGEGVLDDTTRGIGEKEHACETCGGHEDSAGCGFLRLQTVEDIEQKTRDEFKPLVDAAEWAVELIDRLGPVNYNYLVESGKPVHLSLKTALAAVEKGECDGLR